MSALGLHEGQHKIGQMNVEIRDRKAYVAGTNTLCGSVATMIECVHILMKATGIYFLILRSLKLLSIVEKLYHIICIVMGF